MHCILVYSFTKQKKAYFLLGKATIAEFWQDTHLQEMLQKKGWVINSMTIAVSDIDIL